MLRLLTIPLLFLALQSFAQYHLADTIGNQVYLAHHEGDFDNNGIQDTLSLYHSLGGYNSTLRIRGADKTSLLLECGDLGDDSWGSIFGPSDFDFALDTSDARLVVKSPTQFIVISRYPHNRSYEYESWNIRWEDGYYWIIGYDYHHKYFSHGEFEMTSISVNLLTQEVQGEKYYCADVFDEDSPEHSDDLSYLRSKGPLQLREQDALPSGGWWWN